jgi:hypothetical protein
MGRFTFTSYWRGLFQPEKGFERRKKVRGGFWIISLRRFGKAHSKKSTLWDFPPQIMFAAASLFYHE